MANPIEFPNIKPSSRNYTPGRYPQTEFVAQNGAKSVIRYGNKKVDSKLTLGFTNIDDSEANQILNLYEEVNSDYDYIEFGANFGTTADDAALVGLSSGGGFDFKFAELDQDNQNRVKLRYRFDGPPTVTSVRPGISNVQCKFVACLDGD
tara:strand:- start:442 stop:891 length:450 start_codon:yes stop_codon:yes gene_type:complete